MLRLLSMKLAESYSNAANARYEVRETVSGSMEQINVHGHSAVRFGTACMWPVASF
jgi:hypothetical protein